MIKILVITVIFMLFGCKKEVKFEPLGDKLSGPSDVAVSENGAYFYILNSDPLKDHNEGSILVVTSEGKKVKIIKTGRFGKVLSVVKNRMMVAYAKNNELDDPVAIIELYDLTAPENPVLKKSWQIEDDPFNVVMAEKDGNIYDHFAVSCLGGKMYLGVFTADLANSQLHKVRNYLTSRRSVFLDPEKEILIAFPTSLKASSRSYQDNWYVDADKGTIPGVPNEIPDTFESTIITDDVKFQRSRFQFSILDIAKSKEENYKFYELFDTNEIDSIVNTEMRWTYFNLKALDGSFDPPISLTENAFLYRSDFWEAKPNPNSKQSFYISHRGIYTTYSNNIIKVTYLKDPKPVIWTDKTEKECNDTGGNLISGYCVSRTDRTFKFDRVYGFQGDETAEKSYPGDFEVKMVSGQQILIVNHFKGLGNFSDRNDQGYRIVSKTIGTKDDQLSVSSLNSTDYNNSYFNIALNNEGRAMTGLFYGKGVQVIDILPGEDISVPQLEVPNPIK